MVWFGWGSCNGVVGGMPVATLLLPFGPTLLPVSMVTAPDVTWFSTMAVPALLVTTLMMIRPLLARSSGLAEAAMAVSVSGSEVLREARFEPSRERFVMICRA